MIGRRPGFVAPLAWRGLIVLAAGLALGAEVAVRWEQAPAVAPSMLADPDEKPGPAPSPPDVYAAIGEHPLFQASRSPWTAPAAPRAQSAARTPAAPTDYVLAGVVISDSGRSAIVRPGNAPQTILISEGQTLNGWTLRRIDAAGLHFEAGNQAFDLGFPNIRPSGR
jgi:hypothetical protein